MKIELTAKVEEDFGKVSNREQRESLLAYVQELLERFSKIFEQNKEVPIKTITRSTARV